MSKLFIPIQQGDIDPNGIFTCEENGPRRVATAIRRSDIPAIVRAVNAHDDLVAALQSIFEECTLVHKHWGDGCNQKQANEAIKNARAALAKATS